ncbi:hypothetical protein CCMA1212_000537 [Trichoderma ghanense]|uniref:Uncharacterized protein n=1 Tax=Trichoderma ghanense TaxID=65468 RepID=A0ABY2HHB8_9HYPO
MGRGPWDAQSGDSPHAGIWFGISPAHGDSEPEGCDAQDDLLPGQYLDSFVRQGDVVGGSRQWQQRTSPFVSNLKFADSLHFVGGLSEMSLGFPRA